MNVDSQCPECEGTNIKAVVEKFDPAGSPEPFLICPDCELSFKLEVQIACDKCTQGVMDAFNPHRLGICKCNCHSSDTDTDHKICECFNCGGELKLAPLKYLEDMADVPKVPTCVSCKEQWLNGEDTDKYAELLKKCPDPHNIVGKEVPAADGGDYGHRVISYDPRSKDYIVQPIKWSTGQILGAQTDIDWFKISYRYQLDKARQA